MRNLFFSTLIFILFFTSEASAKCDAKAEGASSYIEAEAFVYKLPEVKAWKNLVDAVPNRKVVTIPMTDSQILINGKCYWTVNLYEDTPEMVIRWNMFYIHIKSQHVLVGDITGGDPMTLKQWRAQLKNSSSKNGGRHDY